MLLRRVIEHVKAQNWTAVGLDFAIVVFGVFMGFQVDRWYEAARDRASEKVYLQRLHNDITHSIGTTQGYRAFFANLIQKGDIVLRSLEDCTLKDEDKDAFATALHHMGKHVPTAFVRDTFDELLAAGQFGLLRNEKIKSLLSETARQLESQDKILPQIQGRVNAQLTYLDQSFRFHFTDRPGRTDDIRWESLTVDFEALCQDEKFIAGMSAVQQIGYVPLDWYDGNLALFEQTKKALEAELGVTKEKTD